MLRTPVLALGLITAGCAAPAATLPGTAAPSEGARPASPEAVVSLAPLAPAPRPDLPAPLRPRGPSVVPTEAAMDHGGHTPLAMPSATGHSAMDHGAMRHAEDAPPLALALDAYLDVQEALAADDLAPVQAQAFADAWSQAADRAPDADPHFWHMRAEAVTAVRTHAVELADAASIDDARAAFGRLSAPFLALIEAHGTPEGYDLTRFTCGMRDDLPQGGVWLQRGAEPRNPYFGSRMLTCATRSSTGATVPARTDDLVVPEASGAVDHDAMDHIGHDG